MLEPHSVQQVLRVLELARQNKRMGFDTEASCSRAIKQTAKENAVAYQTIGDGCRRRLNLPDMGQFHRLVDEWLKGNSNPMVSVLRENSARSSHARIDAFLSADRKGETPAQTRAAPEESRAIELSVPVADARMLQALAQLENKDQRELAVEILRSGVRDRMRAALA